MAHKTILAAGALGLIVACGEQERTASSSDSTAAATAAAPTTITVPAGFKVEIFADTLGLTRHIAVAPNGDVYVNSWRSPYDSARRIPAGGFVMALRDTNRDGKADLIQRFGQTSEAGGQGGTGIALYQNAVYAEAGPYILRYRLKPNELAPTAAADTIVTGLPVEGDHPMHPIAIDPKGNLFVNVGSATNACQEKNRELESSGHKPCRELETRAGIWRFSATQTGQRYSPATRYATGIRNADGVAIHPGDGSLYSTQHGRDQLHDNWPKIFTQVQGANLPSEELLQVQKGGDYGWPYCYYDAATAGLMLAPEYGGDGKTVGTCATKRKPVAAFPAHWAPLGLTFYDGSMFPAAYKGGAFIAFHGSWNRAPLPQEGYNVVFQPLANGKAAGPYQVFADGFAGPNRQPAMAEHRPAGVAVGPDGALYITDDQRGRVWRITYNGQ